MFVLKILYTFVFLNSELIFGQFNEPRCVRKEVFAKKCDFYQITNKNGCFPYSLDNCKVIKTTRNEFKCPKYYCELVRI